MLHYSTWKASSKPATKLVSLYSTFKGDIQNKIPNETILPMWNRVPISGYCKVEFRFRPATQRQQPLTVNCGNTENTYFLTGRLGFSLPLFSFSIQLCGTWFPVALVFICQWSSNISVFVQPFLQRVIHPPKPSVEEKQTADLISQSLHGDHLKFKSEWLGSTVLAFISCWYTDSCMLCY